uniref:DUF668 domain-containing protein n=1 Tax=Ananas comosus var. bracteatus TaxID=296719 RepID=A0A6V7QM03_ANACO|nr:unnamed protein product [Ananas comosus var. bracteatus]
MVFPEITELSVRACQRDKWNGLARRGGAMVAEPLIHKMLSALSLDSSPSSSSSSGGSGGDKKKSKSKSKSGGGGGAVGILSFERYLAALAVAERLDELNRVAAAAARLGRRCSVPALLGFEHVHSDLLSGRPLPAAPSLLLPPSAVPHLFRKMDRLAAATAALYAELEALADLEQSAKKLSPDAAARRALDNKIRWQRHDVRHLRDASLWNHSFDSAVLLLARAVCSLHSRLRLLFGPDPLLPLLPLFPSPSPSPSLPPNSNPPSQPIQLEFSFPDRRDDAAFRLNCSAAPGRLFMDCLSLTSSAAEASFDDDDDHHHRSGSSHYKTGPLLPPSGEQGPPPKSGRIATGRLKFGPKTKLTALAPPSTVGGSALALHYANTVIIIEKLLRYPHLVGEEVRDDLYQMLPSSLRAALRKSLKSYVKTLAIYDAPLAHDWKEKLEKILVWLAPMAHSMIRWQTERNFEQQQIVLKGNVLLLETLYFADREKTEAVICELLVGLNYICRYEQQQNALLDCASSLDFDDCMDWQRCQSFWKSFPPSSKRLIDEIEECSVAGVSRVKSQSVSELKDFVKKLNSLPEIARHVNLAQHLQSFTCKPSFHGRLDIRANNSGATELRCKLIFLLSDTLTFCLLEIVDSFPGVILRTDCQCTSPSVLFSLTNSGLPRKNFDYLRREILHSYGFEHMPSLYNLEKAGLLKKQETKNNWLTITKALQLIVDQTGTSNPNDISYIFSGYAPLSIRLVQHAIRSGWRSIEEIIRLLPGPHLDLKRGVSNANSISETVPGAQSIIDRVADGRRSLVLVVFIGGVTFAEIAALRFLSAQEGIGYDFIVGTTKIVNGNTILDTLISTKN